MKECNLTIFAQRYLEHSNWVMTKKKTISGSKEKLTVILLYLTI